AMPFRLDQAIDYAELEPGLPPGRGWFTLLQAVAHLPQAVANETAINLLKNGIPPRLDQVTLDRSVAENSVVAVAGDNKLLALVKLGTSGRLDKRGDFALLKVFHY
ncbi:MAG TPA: hypothetical protein VKA69_11705, partial [Desulfobacteria bacterium]|nr:hypothetical protein [Desulfobacteria bacterium]